MLKKSFDAVVDDQCKFLILGSMPGDPSLAAGEYYAHPRNLFWPFMYEIFGVDREPPYKQRLLELQKNGIALWDVMQRCERKGSKDSNIKNEIPNDFSDFFAKHRQIDKIGFNGQKAFHTFNKYVLLPYPEYKEKCTVLPSTSPANASKSRAYKLHAWRAFFDLC